MSTQATTALLRFARRWFDERTVANVFEPLLADHQREWLDAAPAARLRITMRTAAAFVVALLTLTPRALFLTATPAPITRRVIARMIIFISVVSALSIIPFIKDLSVVPAGALWQLAFWLLPGSVLLAFPFAMGFAVDGIRRHSTPTAAERLAFVRAAVVAVACTVILHGWIVPESNQQFRLTVWGDRQPVPARGARELTSTQLFSSPRLARAEPARIRDLAIQREAHTRASFAVLPVVLMWMRWVALRRPSRWVLPAWLAVTLSGLLYFGIRSVGPLLERRWDLIPGIGAWLPLAAFMVFALTRDYFTKRATAV